MSYGSSMAAEAAYQESSKIPYREKKVKRPGFLTRWFLKKLTDGAEYENRGNPAMDVKVSTRLSVGPTSIDQPERALQFTVYVASGGRVVETRRYDRKTDRSTNGLYVITNDADFGKEIDKIITMESLRG